MITSTNFVCGQPIRRLLVTGASGFIGNHITQFMRRSFPQTELVACDLNHGSGAAAENLRELHLDIRDQDACMRVFNDVNPSHVLHAAAVTEASEAMLHQANVQGTINVMTAASRCEAIQRCVMLSSSAVYGGASTGGTPCDEDSELSLVTGYARSKRAAELCCMDVERASGIPVVIARLGPCYGPGERSGAYRTKMSLVGTLLEALRTGTRITVAGENYSRDWTHLDQVADALSWLLSIPRINYRIYNVSAGMAISARDMIQVFIELGLHVEWTDSPHAQIVLDAKDERKPLVVRRLCEDTGFAPEADWKARIASLIHQATV